jgi:hypothetical protein
MAKLVEFKKEDGSQCYINAMLVTVLYGSGENTIICTAGVDQSKIVVKGDVRGVAVKLGGYKD